MVLGFIIIYYEESQEVSMISNQIIQQTIDGVKEITGLDLTVYDREANVLAQTEDAIRDIEKDVKSFAKSGDDIKLIKDKHFFKVYDDDDLSFVVVVDSASSEAKTTGKMVAFHMNHLLVAYKDKYDRDDFIKNLLLDNLLLVDILNRSQKLHIEMRARRVVFLIEVAREKDAGIMETIRSLFAGGIRDFITAVDEKDIIVVKEMSEEETTEDLNMIAHELVDTLESEVMVSARVSFGTVVNDIKEVSRSYKEAKMALDVGNIFYSDRKVVAYGNLGIGRLIYQLPLQLCKMFIREIFGSDGPVEFDEETLTTINQFFSNNLNVSKTSRELYIHRNTLVYRLDKLQKMTGLDIQTFEDAITFQIALMVMKYMNYLETIEY